MSYSLTEVSRVEKIKADGLEVTRVLDVTPYAARGQAYSDLVGGVRLIGGRLVRFPPLIDPAFPWCRVAEITCEGLDDDYLDGSVYSANYNPLLQAAPYHGPARLTVVYRTPEGGQDQQDIDNAQGQGNGDPEDPQSSGEAQEIELADHAWEFSNTQVPIPGTLAVWERTDGHGPEVPLPAGSVVGQSGALAVRKVIPKLDYQIVRKLVVKKPTQAILGMLGRVNKSAIVLAGDRYEPETVRFDGASARRQITNLGVKCFEISYKFCVCPIWDRYWKGPGPSDTATGYVGWNRFYRFEKDWYQYLYTGPKTSNRRVYQFDEDAPSQKLGGRTVKGFGLLFNPYAS